jgi:hypothetical protein
MLELKRYEIIMEPDRIKHDHVISAAIKLNNSKHYQVEAKNAKSDRILYVSFTLFQNEIPK